MALAAAAAAGRGFAYSVRGGLYLSLTNETNSVSLIESRGPGFTMPKASGFALLDDSVEPTGASAESHSSIAQPLENKSAVVDSGSPCLMPAPVAN
jgi:hypothetical protein